jgi:dTDP-4-amino-4,6-dideoxygalactose transaminase
VGLLRGDLRDGDAVSRLESQFAAFTGVPGAVAVPSGRAGLRFIFDVLALDPGSEVVCSAFGYPVVPYLAASLGHRVRFADCELDTLGMDPRALERAISPRTRVVIATHLYGVPCRIDEIAEIARYHGAALVEDCAHCYGAAVADRKVGSIGRFGYFSFETSKPINALGGGMVSATSPEDVERLWRIARAEPPKRLRWLARRLAQAGFEAAVTHPVPFNLAVYPALRVLEGRAGPGARFASGYHRDEITLRGRLGRFTNYQARLALRQMPDAEARLARRESHARRLMERLAGRVRFQRNDRPDVRSNYMLVTALFPSMRAVARRLLELGVDTKHRYMRDCSGLVEGGEVFARAARAEREVLHLPAYPELSERQIDGIAERIARAVESVGAIEKTAALAR